MGFGLPCTITVRGLLVFDLLDLLIIIQLIEESSLDQYWMIGHRIPKFILFLECF